MNKILTLKRIVLALVAFALVFTTLPALAERGDDAGRKSKNGKVEGTIDGVSVTIEYGRPKVKGREIFGKLVPYGKVWRTGADEATAITFGSDVKVAGKDLAAGTYALFTIPGEGEWTLIFNSVAAQWGAYEYAQGKDALRVMATPKATDGNVEEMTIAIEGSHVVLSWANVAVPFPVAAGG